MRINLTKTDKTIYCFVGIPCAGKSTKVNELKKISNFEVLSRDDIREIFISKDYIYTKENEAKVTKIFNELYDEYVRQGSFIILDNTHCKEKYLQEVLKKVPEGYIIIFMFFDIPLWKAYYRNVLRYIWKGKWIPFKVIRDMKNNYDKIDRSKYLMRQVTYETNSSR